MGYEHQHSLGGSHDHTHPSGLSNGRKDFSKAFFFGIILNIGFIVVEIIYGLFTHSLALLADAGHNFSDVIGLFLSWGAIWLSKRKASEKFTYGLKGSSILAALGNSILLLVAVGGIVWEAIQRFQKPVEVSGPSIIVVAAIGILINGLTALLFLRGSKSDLNIRSAFLHMAADALVSLSVVIAGVILIWKDWAWIDPAVSLLLATVIIVGTWGLFKESINLALAAVPSGIQLKEVHSFLKTLPGVSKIHDLHIWAMSTTETAMTAHLVMSKGHPGDQFLKDAAHQIESQFKIHHVTIQIECGDSGQACELEPAH